MWFAYAVCFTFPHPGVWIIAVCAAAFKEYYIDKHFEVNQAFGDNTMDFLGYCSGILLAILVHSFAF